MKKFIKLIVLLFVLVGLIIGYFVYDSYLKKQEEQPTPTVEEPKTFDVHVLGGESITSIQYVHKERDAQGNVTKEENISLKLMDGKWKLESDLEFPVDPTYVGYMIESLSRITATKVIAENLDNQADYGMNDPLYEIKYSTTEGNEYVYTLGMKNPVVDEYYFKTSTQNKIYLTNSSVYDDFSFGIIDMTLPDDIPTAKPEQIKEVEFTVNGISRIITTDKTGMEDYDNLYFTYDENGKKIPVEGQIGAEFMYAVANATKEYVKGYKVDAETLNGYGLGENKMLVLKVKFDVPASIPSNSGVNTTEEKQYTIYIGKHTDESQKVTYYSMFENSNILYGLNGGEALFKAIESDFESEIKE